MKKWKKFIAMGLAVSMIVPSCIPQTLWASEFSAGSVESAADVFEDGAGYETGNESGNKISDENNSGDEFGTEGKGFDTERDAAQSALDDLKKAQESGNLDDMKAKLEALNEKAQALAVKLYEQAAAAQQAQAGAEGAQTADNSGDDVVDGEFTEK